MANNIVNTYSSTIISIFSDVVKNYETAVDTIKDTELQLNDILHEIELSPPKDASHGYLMYKEIRDLRIKRRKAKEEAELLHDIYEYFKSQSAQTFRNKVSQLQGDAAKLRSKQESRTYTPRKREDLSIVGKTSTDPHSFEEMIAEWNKNKATMRGGKFRRGG